MNRAVQPQKIARSLKFRITVVDGLYYPYSENKGADHASLFSHMQKSGFLTTRLKCVKYHMSLMSRKPLQGFRPGHLFKPAYAG